MGNFKDFDLDLRNVAESGTVDPNGYGSTLLCSAIKLTLQQKCNSVETPTTGMTTACCNKKASDSEPQCI